MNRLVSNIVYILIALLLMGMIFLGQRAYTHALAYEAATTEMVSMQGAEEQAKLQFEKLATSILGSLVSNEKQMKIEHIRQKQEIEKREAHLYTVYYMMLLVGVLLSYVFISLRAFTFFGSFAAMITLFFGLMAPILMVTIHKEVEYLGDIVLSFESKGVIGSVAKLFESGDWIVALVILLFSVLVPLAKVSSLLFVSIFMESRFASHLVQFFKMIGKWSMVDVFVVAVFLVYLTANKGEVSRAEVEVGLYFFLAYVILSMLVSLSADKLLHPEQKIK